MQKNKEVPGGKHEHPLRQEISDRSKAETANAHKQADKDMLDDVELTAGHPNDDLDEGETARLGDKTDLI